MNDLTPEEFKAVQKIAFSHEGFQFKVVSDSMRPVLKVGSLVRLKPVADITRLKRFDIIVFRDRGALTCHFVWTHNTLGAEPTVTTRSLKYPGTDDLPVPQSALLGQVRSHRIPLMARARILLRNLWGRNF